MTTQSEYAIAYEKGQQVERWFEGWDDQDARNRGLSHGND